MTDTPASQIQPLSEPDLPDGFQINNGRLLYRGIDLLSFIERPISYHGRIEMLSTPLYVRRLPALRDNYQQLQHWFDTAKARINYPRDLTIAYASKANPSAPVTHTLLKMGATYECSSSFDVDIVRHSINAGWLDRDRMVLANGFKIPSYLNNLIRLRSEGFEHIIPIIDDLDEIDKFAASGLEFEVGLRSRTESKADILNRFGMAPQDMEYAAWQVMKAGNLHLTTFHAMQMTSMKKLSAYKNVLRKSLQQYASLWRIAPTMHQFNLGGGLPGRNSGTDFQAVFNMILETIVQVCAEENVPVPDLIVEPGRYLVEDHACKVFNIVKTKVAEDGVPFYMIDGSIMSNFPDAWALGDQFRVLPLNHWDGPFQQARLAGLTCDRDDIYPTHKMPDIPLNLPVDADGLVVAFFDCGAYQETLGGRHGAKHCLLPEGSELILDEDTDGELCYTYLQGQSVMDVLNNLGYAPEQIERQVELERLAL